MINQLDEMLQFLLRDRLNDVPVDEIPPGAQIDVEVRPPNDDWRATVNANGRPAVSIYLAEVREDREQRTGAANDRLDPEPYRIDCHYIISAWIPTADPGFATPTVVEDWLLGETLRILADEAPINATRIYNGSPPPDLEPLLIDNDLRTEIAPPEGYSNLADFWTGLGQGNIWHPAAHLIVTLPLVRTTRPVGPPVTTLHTTYLPGPEVIVHIGGTIRDGSGDPIDGAWVRLNHPDSGRIIQATTTDDSGRFRLYGLAEGAYTLEAVAPAGTSENQIVIPEPLGNYDLVLT